MREKPGLGVVSSARAMDCLSLGSGCGNGTGRLGIQLVTGHRVSEKQLQIPFHWNHCPAGTLCLGQLGTYHMPSQGWLGWFLQWETGGGLAFILEGTPCVQNAGSRL